MMAGRNNSEGTNLTSVLQDPERSSSPFLTIPELLDLAPSDGEKVWRGFDEQEVLRLLLQTLNELGYKDVALSLEEASGVTLLDPDVQKLQGSILSGKWQDACRALLRLPLDFLTRQGCLFLLMQQKFIEALMDPESSLEQKVQCLRKDLCASAFDSATTERVHECASLLMYTGCELTAQALRISCISRSQLFNRLTCLLPPSTAMQPSRLATILSHARRFQELCCPLHAEPYCSSKEIPILPHRCKKPLLPQCCVGCLHAHQKEVWSLALAPSPPHSTEILVASGAADKSVCVWLLTANSSTCNTTASPQETCEPSDLGQPWSKWQEAWLNSDGEAAVRVEQTQPLPIAERGSVVGTCQLLWRVQRLTSAAAFLDWDSTGTVLAVGCETAFVEAWEEGRRIADFCTHSGSLVALQWVPGSRRLMTIGSDRTINLLSFHQSGAQHTHVVDYEWSLPARPQEGFLLPGGGSIMVFFADRQAKVFDLISKEETFWMQGKDLVVAACASKVSNQLLLSTANCPPVLRLWDLDERRVVQKYRGHKMGRLALRPAFGGPAEELVISGSEGEFPHAQIYIWHRLWGCMLQQLRGHAAPVNQVAWLQSRGSLCLISAGDDGVLLLWSAPKKNTQSSLGVQLTEEAELMLLKGDGDELESPLRPAYGSWR
ncbi:hypothetical protein Efla_001944 [Eimeria flavescens]